MAVESQQSIVFIGIADKAVQSADWPGGPLKWNVLGLKSILWANFYPLPVNGLLLGFAIRVDPSSLFDFDVSLITERGVEIGRVRMSSAPASDREPQTRTVEQTDPEKHQESALMMPMGDSWTPLFVHLTPLIAVEPSRIGIVRRSAGEEDEKIGEFAFALVEPAPLTPERIAAIKSDPEAAKAVRIELGCKFCPTKLGLYAALDRSTAKNLEKDTWYEEAPDRFDCECGKTAFDLGLIKRNLFAGLGHQMAAESQLGLVPLYEASALQKIRVDFENLLNRAQTEEEIQKFIEQYPILLHQFPSERIFFKAPILTRFKTDFVILSSHSELLLVEIEPADLRLMNKNGDVSGKLSHAIDQVRNWLHDVDEHRLAVLDSLSIPKQAVSSVRGVVIAGRDKGYDADQLRRLKGHDRGRVTFLTYDDILGSMESLEKKMRRL